MRLYYGSSIDRGLLGQNPARQAAIKSGIPKEKPAYMSSIKFVDLA